MVTTTATYVPDHLKHVSYIHSFSPHNYYCLHLIRKEKETLWSKTLWLLLSVHVLGTARIWDPAMWLQRPSSEPYCRHVSTWRARVGTEHSSVSPKVHDSCTAHKAARWTQGEGNDCKSERKKKKRGRQKFKGNLNNQSCPWSFQDSSSRNYLSSHIGNPLIHLMIMSWVPDAPN